MQTALWRLIIRLVVLFVWVFSIFFFYVFGYKYDSKIGFVKSSWVYDIKYYSDETLDENILINWWKYYFVSNKLTLHDMRSNFCWEIKIGKFQDFSCYDDNAFSNIVYISPASLKINASSANLFYRLNLKKTDNPFVRYEFNWNWVNFSYYKNWDLVYEDDISTKKLINIKNIEFIGYESWWLYFTLDGNLNFLSIRNNL